MKFAAGDLLWQAPVLVLALTGIFLVVAESFAGGRRGFLMKLAVAGCAAAAIGHWLEEDA